jgi:cytoskeletal protein CcmA (bactofilin family)
MVEERSSIDGDLRVTEDTRLYGSVTGDVVVRKDALFVRHGAIGGSLHVEGGASAHIYGTINGDVFATGARSSSGRRRTSAGPSGEATRS